jgi:hypothetical protein
MMFFLSCLFVQCYESSIKEVDCLCPYLVWSDNSDIDFCQYNDTVDLKIKFTIKQSYLTFYIDFIQNKYLTDDSCVWKCIYAYYS